VKHILRLLVQKHAPKLLCRVCVRVCICQGEARKGGRHRTAQPPSSVMQDILRFIVQNIKLKQLCRVCVCVRVCICQGEDGRGGRHRTAQPPSSVMQRIASALEGVTSADLKNVLAVKKQTVGVVAPA